MFYKIFVVLITLSVLGLATSVTLGGLIRLLLLSGAIVLPVHLLRPKRI
jgi:hypothetical protein